MDQVRVTPTLVRIGSVVSLAFGGLFFLMAFLVSIGRGDTSALADSALGRWAIPFWCLSSALMGALLLVIGYGMRKGESWARPLAVLFWVVSGALGVVRFLLELRVGPSTFSLLWVPGFVIAAWYFYFKGNVVQYYKSLKQKELESRAA
jgi:hypothetical protein